MGRSKTEASHIKRLITQAAETGGPRYATCPRIAERTGKFVLGYADQISVSISMNNFFMVKTASVYKEAAKPFVIE